MDYDEARRAKYEQGIAEHRPDGGPFKGDIVTEMECEGLDVGNYADEGLAMGVFTEDEAVWLRQLGNQIWMAMQMVHARREEEPTTLSSPEEPQKKWLIHEPSQTPLSAA